MSKKQLCSLTGEAELVWVIHEYFFFHVMNEQKQSFAPQRLSQAIFALNDSHFLILISLGEHVYLILLGSV